jgi:hypothetical protein
MTLRTANRIATAPLLALGFVGIALGAGANASVARSGTESEAAVFTVHQIFSGTTLTHEFTPTGSSTPSSEELAGPDDITELGGDIFVGFQNGVGPQGQPSTDGNLDSTVVELQRNGDPVAQWDLEGKTDGVTADPSSGLIMATVNEDANSSLYTINPDATSPASAVTHYAYSEALPHLGGTDAISIYRGQILISASAPGTTGAPAPQPGDPAVYSVTLKGRVATVAPLFGDEADATVANVGSSSGQPVQLGLTDPDSNEVVPAGARFGGDFMLTSQGDQEQIFARFNAPGHLSLSVLSLSQSVDDTAWPSQSRGVLYSTDSTNDSVDTLRGPFVPDQPIVVATPCGANSAPGICPAPPLYPSNYLASLDPNTGQVTALTVEGAAYTPQGGLLFMPRDSASGDSPYSPGLRSFARPVGHHRR